MILGFDIGNTQRRLYPCQKQKKQNWERLYKDCINNTL